MSYYQSQTQPYYLIPRKGIRKKTVYYYRVFGENRKPIGEWSTGQTNRFKAESFCRELLKENRLIPTARIKGVTGNPSLFKDYFNTWFLWKTDNDPECPYIQKRLKRGLTYSRSNASIQRSNFEKYLIPTFGDRPKSKITAAEIEEWLYSLPETKGISNTTANNQLRTLRLMLGEALRLGHLKSNPAADVQKLGQEEKKKDILRWKEVDSLFKCSSWSSQIARTGTILAACTGMRLGEIRALQREFIYPDKIIVKYSLDNMHGNLKSPKNGRTREIPITQELYDLLSKTSGNRDGFIFSLDGGKTAVTPKYFRDHFIKALTKIKIDRKIQKQRNIVFHGWRVFFNTVLQLNGIPDVKVRAIIGHLNESMTEHYTNVPLEAYKTEKNMSISEIQNRIILGGEQ